MGAQGPAAFGQAYLQHLLVAQQNIEDAEGNVIIAAGTPIDFAELHHEIFAVCSRPAGSALREAFVAPRGFAKSTAMLIVLLWWAAYRKRKFVVWVSETASQVEELAAGFIDEVELNEALRTDFPHLLPAKDSRNMLVMWNDRDIVCASGFRLSARGVGKAMRGLRRGANRPDAICADDVDGESSTGVTQYLKVRRWLTRTAAPMLGPGGDILWLNTLVDWHSVTGALIRGDEDWTRTWTVRHFAAEWWEDADGNRLDHVPAAEERGALVHKLLWPEYWPTERIQAFIDLNGFLAYSWELLNRPYQQGDKLFKSHTLDRTFYVVANQTFRSDRPPSDWVNSSLLTHVTAIDPAFGGKDYAAVVTVAVFNQDYFVREAKWDRGENIRTEMVREAVRQAEFYNSRCIYCESTAAQIMVADELVQRSRLPVKKLYPVRSKVDRALPTAIRADQGHIYFEKGKPQLMQLREILSQFPDFVDDPVDALIYAIEGAAELRSRFLVRS